MKRSKKDPTAWRSAPDGVYKYECAKRDAQARADTTGFDYGIEANDVFKEWVTFMLPRRENRRGHELRCEVVSPSNLNVCQPGHGLLLGQS